MVFGATPRLCVTVNKVVAFRDVVRETVCIRLGLAISNLFVAMTHHTTHHPRVVVILHGVDERHSTCHSVHVTETIPAMVIFGNAPTATVSYAIQ